MSDCTSPGDPSYSGSVAITGSVTGSTDGAKAYVRLLDANADFVAEVPASPAGEFTFYAVPGTWIVRAITSAGSIDHRISVTGPEYPPIRISV